MILPVKELDTFDQGFNFFEHAAEPRETLLIKGLYPPLAIAERCIVWGFPILCKARSLGISELEVVHVTGDLKTLTATALELENRCDGYSLKEQGNIVRFLRSKGDNRDIHDIEHLIRSSGSVVYHVDQYLQLDEAVKSLVDKGCIDLKTGSKLVHFGELICGRILELQDDFTFSRMRAFVVYLNEIGKREGMAEPELADLLETVLSREDPSKDLYEKRYPQVSNLEKRFGQFCQEQLRGKGIILSHPPEFEGSALTVKFTFRTGGELLRKCDYLKDISGPIDGLISDLF